MKNFFFDFEYSWGATLRPLPISGVIYDMDKNYYHELWLSDENAISTLKELVAQDGTFFSYYSSAEMSCLLKLGIQFPEKSIDLCIEFRNLTNSCSGVKKNDLLSALSYYGISTIEHGEKKIMQELALRGEPFTEVEKNELLKYCKSDVEGLVKLYEAMKNEIDFERAEYRGQFMKINTLIEDVGIPLDIPKLRMIQSNWDEIKDHVISKINSQYDVFEDGVFKKEKFEKYLLNREIDWPLTATGQVKTDKDTMREQAKIHPELFNLKETLEILSQLQLNSLEVAIDGRNRTKLWAFSSKTSRTQPSNAKYIFGLSVWQRFLIKPEKGRALAYIDFSQQEFGIAAALSGDEKMMDCYREGDPYLTFAKQVGRIPREGTKKTHYNEREAFKQLALAVQFGMGVKALRKKLPKGFDAEGMLKLHKRNFAKYWSWVEHEFNKALFTGIIKTRFGWSMRVDETAKPNTVMNFPMQANGSEILRLSCLLINQKNIKICATIHDAVLIEASVDEIQEHVAIAQECMSEAGRIVLNGFSLRSDATIYAWPFNYTDKRGKEMWEIIREVL